eukprot:1873354-Rhodomonas_salina.1
MRHHASALPPCFTPPLCSCPSPSLAPITSRSPVCLLVASPLPLARPIAAGTFPHPPQPAPPPSATAAPAPPPPAPPPSRGCA